MSWASRIALCLMLLFAAPVTAQEKLGLGLFAPEIGFASPSQRYSFARGVAQHLSTALGVEVTGTAYKSAPDFERDVRAHKIQLAIIGGSLAATRGFQVLARAKLASPGEGSWTILAKSKFPVSELKGKRLQIPRLGSLTVAFVEHALLASTVDAKKFLKLRESPDLSSAVTAVKLGKADAVVAPLSTKGLVPLLKGVPFPSPAFVLVDPKLAAGLTAKARAALLSYGATVAGIVGWQAGAASDYRGLAAACQRRVYRMRLSPVAAAPRFDLGLFVDLKTLQPPLPALEDLYWIP